MQEVLRIQRIKRALCIQTTPTASLQVETHVEDVNEDVDEYGLTLVRTLISRSREFPTPYPARLMQIHPSVSPLNTVSISIDSTPNAYAESASIATAMPSLIAPIPAQPFQCFDFTEPTAQLTTNMAYSSLIYGSMDTNLGVGVEMYSSPDVDHTAFGSMGVGMGTSMKYGANEPLVFEDIQFGFASVGVLGLRWRSIQS